MPDRTYSRQEVSAILARAASPGRPEDDDPGLTLAEIEQAAVDSGLDPARVRQAAADLDAGLLAERSDKTTVAERWIDGPFRLDAWEDAVAALRVRYGENAAPGLGAAQPDTSRVGDSHEWTHRTAWGKLTTVTVSPRGDRARIRVVTVADGGESARLQSAALAAVVSLGVALLAGGILADTLSGGVPLAVTIAVFALGTAIGTPLLTRHTERSRARLAGETRTLADDLARQLSRTPHHALNVAEAAPEAVSEPRIDPSLLDAEAPEPESRSSGRRTRV